MTKSLLVGILLSSGTFLVAFSAEAALLSSYQFNGKGNWSIDGVGGNRSPVGTISANLPLGSTVEKAFLYSITFFNPKSDY